MYKFYFNQNLDGQNQNSPNVMFNQFNQLQIQQKPNKQQRQKSNQNGQHAPNNQLNHQASKSRIPCYAANGQSLGYRQPSINYQIHQSISTNDFRSESGLSNSSIVPSDVFNIHLSHLNTVS